jgi:hypothetical protein
MCASQRACLSNGVDCDQFDLGSAPATCQSGPMTGIFRGKVRCLLMERFVARSREDLGARAARHRLPKASAACAFDLLMTHMDFAA